MKWLERSTRVDTVSISRELHDFIKYGLVYNVGCDVIIEVNSYIQKGCLKVHILIEFNLPNKTYYVRDEYSAALDFYDESLLDYSLDGFVSDIKTSITGITVSELVNILKNKD